jgi:hypothetical protein
MRTGATQTGAILAPTTLLLLQTSFAEGQSERGPCPLRSANAGATPGRQRLRFRHPEAGLGVGLFLQQPIGENDLNDRGNRL